jgi:hypothetical protein
LLKKAAYIIYSSGPKTLAVSVAVCLAILGCREPTVLEMRKSLLSKEYCRDAEAELHRISVRYVPPALRILTQFKPDSARILDKRLTDSLRQDAGSMDGIIFHLRIDPKADAKPGDFDDDLIYGTKSGYGGYQENLNAFLFGMKERIWLESDGRKILMTGFQMENNFGMSKGRTFVLAFPGMAQGTRKYKKIELVLDDVVPGLSRKKMAWTLPVGKNDEAL